MDHYLDIQVLADPEFSSADLLNALYAKLHRALGQSGGGRIAISFPEVKKTLGNRLRLHASREDLDTLMAGGWLKGLRDYTRLSSIQVVPATAQHRVVKRVQAKSSQPRLLRRSVAKGWITPEEAEKRLATGCEQQLNLPYLQVKSLSSGQRFLLFVEHGPLLVQPVAGIFSSYGLSPTATIPWF